MYDEQHYVTNEELDRSLDQIKDEISCLPTVDDIHAAVTDAISDNKSKNPNISESDIHKTMFWGSVTVGIGYAYLAHGANTDFVGDIIHFAVSAVIFNGFSAYIRAITR